MTFELSNPLKHQERELAHPLRTQALDALKEAAEKRRTDAHRLESLARELPLLSQAAEEGLWLLVTRGLLPALLLSLTACGFNPMEGDFGPVEWVPERKTCKEKVNYPDGRVNYEMRPCDGGGHDLEVFGEWRYL